MDKKAALSTLHTAQHGEPFVTIAKYQITSPKSADRLKKLKGDARAISIVQAIDDQINVSMSPALPRNLQSIPRQWCKHLSRGNITLIQLKHSKNEINSLLKADSHCWRRSSNILNCFGRLPMTFSINNLTTRQLLFFCEEADHIYLSQNAGVDLSILPPSYPPPMKQLMKSQFMHLKHQPSLRNQTFYLILMDITLYPLLNNPSYWQHSLQNGVTSDTDVFPRASLQPVTHTHAYSTRYSVNSHGKPK